MSSFFTVNWAQIRSACVSIGLAVVLAVAVYIVGVGDIFAIEYKTLINIGVLAGLVGIIDLVKSLLTTKQGDFVGAVNIVKQSS